jgi:acyl transferase domain-containing protein
VFAPGPGNSCLFAQFRGLSATGSRPFDRSADGVVFGDGAAVIALKRLDDAIRDGDRIWAVIRGVGLSSDGKSSSANVPRMEGQVLAMERCYAQSGIDPASVQYVEAHGTATPAGDATELNSLGRFFAARSGAPLHVGSVKGLIGHVGWAAGAASIIKLCLALRDRIIPRQHGFESPQPALAALGPGFVVDKAELPWRENGREPRRAATDGFGFGGTNAHVVLEEFRASDHPPISRGFRWSPASTSSGAPRPWRRRRCRARFVFCPTSPTTWTSRSASGSCSPTAWPVTSASRLRGSRRPPGSCSRRGARPVAVGRRPRASF